MKLSLRYIVLMLISMACILASFMGFIGVPASLQEFFGKLEPVFSQHAVALLIAGVLIGTINGIISIQKKQTEQSHQ